MLRFNIIGVGGKRQLELTRLLESILNRHQIEASLTYTEDLEAIIKSKVEEIPALFVENEHVRINKEFDETHIEQTILNVHRKNNNVMKKILVPTDMSGVAGNAYKYAIQLANKIGGELNTLHVYRSMANTKAPLMLITPDHHKGAYPKHFMQAFVEKAVAELYPKITEEVKVEYELELGYPASVIKQRSSDYDLIVMGKKGKNNLSEKMFGGVTTTVAADVNCPLLIVPEQAEYKNIKRILYTTNADSLKEGAIDYVVSLAGRFNAQVNFVQVKEDENKAYEVQNNLFEQVFADGKEPAVLMELITIKAPSVEEAVAQYVEENKVDMIVMYSKKKNLFKHLFLQSHTRNMAYQTKVPLLVLH